jgi:hypothetical protein
LQADYLVENFRKPIMTGLATEKVYDKIPVSVLNHILQINYLICKNLKMQELII